LVSRSANWLVFFLLSFIWGSSFILMKGGLSALTAAQVASLRIITAGLVLLPYGIKAFSVIRGRRIFIVFLSGTLGNLLPAYLFCLAEENLDSALAGVLNSLTPVFTLLIAFVFFRKKTAANKVLGIVIAFSGTLLLYYHQPAYNGSAVQALPVLMILMATLMYGTNVNLVASYLADVPSLPLAGMALMLNSIPAFIVLCFSGVSTISFQSREVWFSAGCATILGVAGTAFATILFYRLIQRSGIVFSSMVTYAIPVVAIFWGISFGEKFGKWELLSLGVILFGVFMANGTLPRKLAGGIRVKK